VVFLSPILDKTVGAFFQTPESFSKYLKENSETKIQQGGGEAKRLFDTYHDNKVREIVFTKKDLEFLASFAARSIEVPRPNGYKNLKNSISANRDSLTRLKAPIAEYENDITNLKNALTKYKTAIDTMKAQMQVETDPDLYNSLVDKHNACVNKFEQIRSALNGKIDECNAAVREYERVRADINSNVDAINSFEHPYITEIGGGIDLEPSKFSIRQNANSPELIKFKSKIPRINQQWGSVDGAEKWISSGNTNTASSNPRGELSSSNISQPLNRIKHWTNTDSNDGSRKDAIKLDATRSQERIYDGQKHELQVAEFNNGKLASLLVAHTDSSGRIVFQKSNRKNVLPPDDPPRWYSPN